MTQGLCKPLCRVRSFFKQAPDSENVDGRNRYTFATIIIFFFTNSTTPLRPLIALTVVIIEEIFRENYK